MTLGPTGLEGRLPHREGVAWVRVEFTLEQDDGYPHPALLLPHTADATEAVLNGVPLGGVGVIGRRFAMAPSRPLLLPLPPGTLRAGPNTLLLRLLFAGKSARALDAPLYVGGERELTRIEDRILHPILGAEAAYLALFFILTVFYGFLLFQRVLRGEYVFFTLFTAIYGVKFFFGSNWYPLWGASPYTATRLELILSSLLVTVMISLVTSATGNRFRSPILILLAIAGAFTLADVFLDPMTVLLELGVLKKIFLAGVGIFYLGLAGLAVLQNRPESKSTFLGVAVYVAGSRLERFWGLNLQDLAMGGFALCLLFSLTLRHARLKGRLAVISGRLLEAHEEERRRIARDLHDGMGQALLALRLQVQMLAAKVRGGVPVPAEVFDDLARKVLGIIEEVRRTALDLRPSHVERRGLLEGVRWYGENFASQHGIEVVVHEPERAFPEPPERIRDNLFRVLQEALHNVARHAQAHRVDVSLYRKGGTLVLQVADDGKGFDPKGQRGGGIGLATMEERAELLGGSCRVETREGRGTMVTVEVPFR